MKRLNHALVARKLGDGILRCCSTSSGKILNTILRIPKADVYRFGDGGKATPVFKDLEWTITEGDSWAIVGPAGNEKSLLLEVKSLFSTTEFNSRSALLPLIVNIFKPFRCF